MDKLTTTEVSERLGMSRSSIRRMILAGKLPAEKFGRDWLIDSDHLASLSPQRPGRPRKGAKKD
jgi:excisionase family DNA binding protein